MWFWAVQRSALCRSRRELSNAYFLAKFRFDTAANEPCKVCRIPWHPHASRYERAAMAAQPMKLPTVGSSFSLAAADPSGVKGAPLSLVSLTLIGEAFSKNAFFEKCIFRKCIFRKCIFRKCIFRKFCKFLAGSFSAVSKRNFARKYAFDSIFQALQDLHPFAPLQSQNFSKKSVWKISIFCESSAKSLQKSQNTCKILLNFKNFS